MDQLSKEFQQDIKNIDKISIVPHILNVICQTTGMGFAAVARVTDKNWIVCKVKDDISFGLQSGDELEIKTTICNEIRHSGKAVVINSVKDDENFKDHHTPALYGFQSYISVPLTRQDKSFFGTLCAIDPSPNNLERPEIIDMFNLFADLISFHLETIERMDSTLSDLELQRNFTEILEEKIKERTAELDERNELLLKTNKELQEFNYISSHDLQEPLRKIQTFISRIQLTESDTSENNSIYLTKISDCTNRMRILINDLLSYSQTNEARNKFQETDINTIVSKIIEDLKEEIHHKSAIINVHKMCAFNAIPFQISQLFYNLVGNSLKYSSTERQLRIDINSEIIPGKNSKEFELQDIDYCHIKIADNGIGFDPQYKTKIFGLFQRLHVKTDYAGTGVGLAIVKKIVENHKGFISADGISGKGAEFNIYIPAV